MPDDIPATVAVVAVVAVIDAVPDADVDHVAPLVVDDNTTLLPTHNSVVPVIATGSALTVIALVTKQPEDSVYLMVVPPPATPVAIPVPELIEPTAGAELLHEPPVGVLMYVSLDPAHTVFAPVITDGASLTETALVVKQPVDVAV